MKKILSGLILLLCAGLSASAQEQQPFGPARIGVRIGYAYKPATGTDYFYSSFPSLHIDDTRMDVIYHDYHGPIWSTGTLTASVDIQFQSWFFLSINGGWALFRADTYDGVTEANTGRKQGSVCYLLPAANIYYYKADWYRIYGGLGFGVGLYSSFFDSRVRFEPQFTPVGIEAGNKLFAFLEAGYGSLFCGVRGGIGYKF